MIIVNAQNAFFCEKIKILYDKRNEKKLPNNFIAYLFCKKKSSWMCQVIDHDSTNIKINGKLCAY
jgi:hypothetical protein